MVFFMSSHLVVLLQCVVYVNAFQLMVPNMPKPLRCVMVESEPPERPYSAEVEKELNVASRFKFRFPLAGYLGVPLLVVYATGQTDMLRSTPFGVLLDPAIKQVDVVDTIGIAVDSDVVPTSGGYLVLALFILRPLFDVVRRALREGQQQEQDSEGQ
jgi:hypothetical protein